ncbi:MAG: prepilin-type N-terminal cleavage/methylation domain-containing protein [Candidatus Hinthialibacter antarcticus]|nr:prepilin-type N-terminal cleavage/methylation domain-containing protein [Candidatus Hinthialibacter antarcticus]
MKPCVAAFTLIELLIVVAIIGILAAIAVPNFLNAQVRANIARVHADQKALENAIEQYFLDNNGYPPSSHSDNANLGSTKLTSPIAYLNQVLVDPFAKKYENSRGNDWDLVYEFNTASWPRGSSAVPRNIYIMESLGPDQYDNFNSTQYPSHNAEFEFYDSTNGVVSFGDIVRAGGAWQPRWYRERAGGRQSTSANWL